MNYLERLFNKYSGVSRTGRQPTIDVFKQAVTEALAKQRELMFEKYMKKSCSMIGAGHFRLRALMRDIFEELIIETKLEEQDEYL